MMNRRENLLDEIEAGGGGDDDETQFKGRGSRSEGERVAGRELNSPEPCSHLR